MQLVRCIVQAVAVVECVAVTLSGHVEVQVIAGEGGGAVSGGGCPRR